MSTISPQNARSGAPSSGAGTGSYSFRAAQTLSANPEMPAKARTLVAAAVEAHANPTAPSSAPASGGLAFYRHPADRNQAATAILAGRTLDVRG